MEYIKSALDDGVLGVPTLFIEAKYDASVQRD